MIYLNPPLLKIARLSKKVKLDFCPSTVAYQRQSVCIKFKNTAYECIIYTENVDIWCFSAQSFMWANLNDGFGFDNEDINAEIEPDPLDLEFYALMNSTIKNGF